MTKIKLSTFFSFFTLLFLIGLKSQNLQAKSIKPIPEIPTTESLKNTFQLYQFQKLNQVNELVLNRHSIQEEKKIWYLDYDAKNSHGINLYQAEEKYIDQTELSEVIVAVIDSGVDVNHPDLHGRLWMNEEEAKNPNDGIDNDGNGYIDDVYGWNFLGAPSGKATFQNNQGHLELTSNPDQSLQINYERNEEVRVYLRLKLRSDSGEELTDKEKIEMSDLLQQINQSIAYNKNMMMQVNNLEQIMLSHINIIRQDGYSGKFDVEGTINLSSYTIQNEANKAQVQQAIKDLLLILYSYNIDYETLMGVKADIKVALDYHYNLDLSWRPRTILGSPDPQDAYYGNNDVRAFNSDNGTHVAGVIAASENATAGIRGIAKNAKIMALRVIPNGDERDQDVANAIYYAVNHGAQVINLSFSKSLSPEQKMVQEAIQYAQANNVQIIHSAGNSGKEINLENNFPNMKALDYDKSGKVFSNFFEIASSSKENNNWLATKYTNYSSRYVDIFAPGMNIYSLAPNQQYQAKEGTSSSAPIVSGIFALCLGMDATLSSIDLKSLLKESARTYGLKRVFRPGNTKKTPPLVYFNGLSSTGGIVDVEKIFFHLNNPFGL